MEGRSYIHERKNSGGGGGGGEGYWIYEGEFEEGEGRENLMSLGREDL
jgi:hypothetical protein